MTTGQPAVWQPVTDVEAMAIAICWAGFVTPQEGTPQQYWDSIRERVREVYRKDARQFLAMWRGPYRWVPKEPPQHWHSTRKRTYRRMLIDLPPPPGEGDGGGDAEGRADG
ncbi:hypothetical protein WDZ11_14595 [Roseomonas mucosa]|uniref:hypothetical protein n=1 Tax=Roseomonas mucosa TaxID=207340 RepID=UPI0030D09F29